LFTQVASDNMQIHDFFPSASLVPFVQAYKIIESNTELINRVLPATSIVMAFRYKGQVNYLQEGHTYPLPAAVITGLRKSVRLINYHTDSATLLVLFTETGASAFFRQPMHELFGESISVEHFVDKNSLSTIITQLSEASRNPQRIAIVERFLNNQIITPRPDLLVAEAINKIQNANGLIKIRELADSLFLSQDAFEKRFRKITGATPKQFASIVRMNALIHSKQTNQSLFDVAFDGNYYDQPHFHKHFKLFTGQTPAEFFKAPSFW